MLLPTRLLTFRLMVLFSCISMTGLIYANTGPIAVKANENTTVSMFFPSPISKVIQPASHFSFTHEPAGIMATLKAEIGNPSNLTVITESGDIFSFALKYSETIQNFTYVISSEQAMGKRGGAKPRPREAPEESSNIAEPDDATSEVATMRSLSSNISDNGQSRFTEANAETDMDYSDSEVSISEHSQDDFIEQGSFYDMDREGYYEIFCENSYLQRTIIKDNMSENGGVDLRLNHLAVDHNELYFTLQFRNVSKSDYHIENVRFYIKTLGNPEIAISPLYTYNLGGLIKQSGVNKFVYVFQDFELGVDQNVFVVMDEKDGSRNIVLPLDVKALKKNLEK